MFLKERKVYYTLYLGLPIKSVKSIARNHVGKLEFTQMIKDNKTFLKEA